MDFDTTRWMFHSKEFPANVQGVKSVGTIHYVNDPVLKAKLESGTEWNLEVQTSNGIENKKVCVETPLIFESIRPITIQDIQEVIGTDTRIILHSTYSGGNKRRAFILYDRLVSPDEHELIARDIYSKIVKKHPYCLMDWTCTRSNSLFYLPCSAIDKESFIDEAGSEPFSVDEWLGMGLSIPTISGPQRSVEIPIDEAKQNTKENTEEALYEQKVLPIIRTMNKGNHFTPAQKATAECKHHCPSLKWRLEKDLVAGELDPKRLKSMMGWFDRMLRQDDRFKIDSKASRKSYGAF